MASIFRRGGETWYIKYRDQNGKQIMRSGYTDRGETQKLARKLEHEIDRIKNGDLDPQHEAVKLERVKDIEGHIDEYESHLQAGGLSDTHVAYTVADIKAFVLAANVKQATGITVAHMDQFVMSLKEAGKDAPSTINRRVGSVKAFLKWMHDRGILSQYVLRKYPKLKTKGLEKRKRRALSAEEVVKLLAVSNGRSDLYNFVLKSGLRHGETASMTKANFDFEHKTITVFANDAKNKDKHQVIPMHPDLIPILKKRSKDEGPTFPELPSKTEAAAMVRKDCEAAKIDTTAIDFHALRHTFISLLARAGVHPKVVQTLARHSNIETTLNYYTHFKRTDEVSALTELKF